MPGSALSLSLSLSHFTSVVLLPLPVVLLLHPPTQEHVHTHTHTHTHTQQTHNRNTLRAHLPLPAVSLFSANVAKCLHFCITATINLPSPPLSSSFPSCASSSSCPSNRFFTPLPPLLFVIIVIVIILPSRFCPLFIILCFFFLRVEVKEKKKTFLNFLFHLALAPGFLLHIPCLPSFSSLSSPALPYFYHSTIHSDPLLSSSFIPLFYMHPLLLLLLLTSPLLPSVLYLLLSYYFYPDPFFSLSSPVLSFSPLGGRFGPVLKKLSCNLKKKSRRSDPPSAVLKTSTVTLHFHVCCRRLDSCQS